MDLDKVMDPSRILHDTFLILNKQNSVKEVYTSLDNAIVY